MSNLENIRIICKDESDDGTYAEFVVDPLERGFGDTIGNSLRRVLLSSIPGVAPNFIKIEGVSHEFSTVPGMREDVTEVVLNVKEIIARLNDCDSKTVYIDVNGPCAFTASMIPTSSDIDILSDNLIATLDDGAHLKMEINFKCGVGYVSADQNRSILPPEIDIIPVDSLFSPVTKVNYFVENTRVGRVTDYNKLILQIWTNGVISAHDALSFASSNLIRHLEPFCALSEGSLNGSDLGSGCEVGSSGDILLDDLGFSVRTYNALKRTGIDRLSRLLMMSRDDILRIRNLGKKSCDEIISKMESFGWKDPESLSKS